jgi:hypothetical protein
MTLRPNGAIARRQATPTEQQHMEHVIEGRAERRYIALDKAYAMALSKRDRKVYKLVQTVDHFVTPIQYKLSRLPEANHTLLVSKWQELRERFSVNEIMGFDQNGMELYDRTIQALEALRRSVRAERRRRLAEAISHFVLALYQTTIGAILDRVLGRPS